MRMIYKPFGILISIVGMLLSKRVFDRVWALFDEEEPPGPKTADTTWKKVLATAAVQGATIGVTRTVVNRAGARGFERLTGTWPGPREPEPAE